MAANSCVTKDEMFSLRIMLLVHVMWRRPHTLHRFGLYSSSSDDPTQTSEAFLSPSAHKQTQETI